jgi:hypothetical protein
MRPRIRAITRAISEAPGGRSASSEERQHVARPPLPRSSARRARSIPRDQQDARASPGDAASNATQGCLRQRNGCVPVSRRTCAACVGAGDDDRSGRPTCKGALASLAETRGHREHAPGHARLSATTRRTACPVDATALRSSGGETETGAALHLTVTKSMRFCLDSGALRGLLALLDVLCCDVTNGERSATLDCGNLRAGRRCAVPERGSEDNKPPNHNNPNHTRHARARAVAGRESRRRVDLEAELERAAR